MGGAGEVTRLVELVGLVTVDLLVEVYRGVLFEGGLLWGTLVGRRRVVLVIVNIIISAKWFFIIDYHVKSIDYQSTRISGIFLNVCKFNS